MPAVQSESMQWSPIERQARIVHTLHTRNVRRKRAHRHRAGCAATPHHRHGRSGAAYAADAGSAAGALCPLRPPYRRGYAPRQRRGVVFLDKDGTLLRDVPYNVMPLRMRFAPGAAAALGRLAQLGMALYIVSNQAGVARGYFPISSLDAVARKLSMMFRQQGARLDGFYFCPYHPDGAVSAYKRESSHRKPAPGMLIDAACGHHVSLPTSWFIGDILDDVEAGNRAGCRTILIDNGNETEWRQSSVRQPTAVAHSIDRAVGIIAAAMRTPQRRLERSHAVRTAVDVSSTEAIRRAA